MISMELRLNSLPLFSISDSTQEHSGMPPYSIAHLLTPALIINNKNLSIESTMPFHKVPPY